MLQWNERSVVEISYLAVCLSYIYHLSLYIFISIQIFDIFGNK